MPRKFRRVVAELSLAFIAVKFAQFLNYQSLKNYDGHSPNRHHRRQWTL